MLLCAAASFVVTKEDLKTTLHLKIEIRPRLQITVARRNHRPRSGHRLSVNSQRDHVPHIELLEIINTLLLDTTTRVSR